MEGLGADQHPRAMHQHEIQRCVAAKAAALSDSHGEPGPREDGDSGEKPVASEGEMGVAPKRDVKEKRSHHPALSRE